MNQVIKKESNALALSVNSSQVLESMLPVHRALIENSLQSKVRDLQPMQVIDSLITVLSTIYTIAGQKPEPETLAIYADEFYNKLQETFPGATLAEIKTALRKGVYDEYGEYYGLNVKTFNFFVSSYMQSQIRKEAIEKFNDNVTKLEKPKLTAEEARRENKVFVNWLYNRYAAGELSVDFIPEFIYSFLTGENIIGLNDDEKKVIFEDAKKHRKQLLGEAVKDMNRTNKPVVASNIRTELMKYEENYTDREEYLKVAIIARKISVHRYFQKMKLEYTGKIFVDVE